MHYPDIGTVVTLNVSLLCQYPIRAIICKTFRNQSTSEACNSCSMTSLVPYVRYGHSCHRKPEGLWPEGFLWQLWQLWQDMGTVATGSQRAVGRRLPVVTVPISHMWHERPCYNYYIYNYRYYTYRDINIIFGYYRDCVHHQLM